MSSDKTAGGKSPAPSTGIDSTIVQRINPRPAAPAAKPAAEPSGRVKHDSRGNAVWNWAAQAAKDALESTSRLLKRLEIPGMKVEEKPKELELEERGPGGGYDPYNTRRSDRR
jgi:hypothetical protein